jgi:hypothetical protein
MDSKLTVDKFIKEIDKKALKDQGKTMNDVTLWVNEKIYTDIEPFLKEGKYKGITIIC